MHVVLLTLMTLSGADVTAAQPASFGHCGTAACGSACGTGVGHSSHYDRKINRQLSKYMSGKRNGPMPQTCYAPRYGCYNGNDRHMHRYPAFHGTYYRRPYNYRNLFEYPWHAEMHEPTSYFSYNVPPEAQPMPQDAPPVLPADAAAQRNVPNARPIVQPTPAPVPFKSAGQTIGQTNIRTVAAPRLNDHQLAGVSIEQDRVVPAEIETLAGATPFADSEIKTGEIKTPEHKLAEKPAPATLPTAPAPRQFAKPAHTPQVASRPLSAGPRMLQPIKEPEDSIAAEPVIANTETAKPNAPAQFELPAVKAKPISLGKPVELKPLAPKTEVKQAKADETTETSVQATSATRPITSSNNTLRATNDSVPAANPLRGSLRR